MEKLLGACLCLAEFCFLASIVVTMVFGNESLSYKLLGFVYFSTSVFFGGGDGGVVLFVFVFRAMQNTKNFRRNLGYMLLSF
jgi:hypothetical protein